MARRLSNLTLIAAILAVALLVLAPTAMAHHRDDHDGGAGNENARSEGSDHDGDADSDEGTAYTEANDGDADDATDPNADDDDNAHPSGKDRSVEGGNSGNQGNSESNPDDSKGPMRYEGELGDDKPGGPGGTDLSDQDGNNGCGNDDDFDDDNNGWCGKPKETEVEGDSIVKGSVTVTSPCVKDSSMDSKDACERGSVTLPDLEVRPAGVADKVLGIRFSRKQAAGPVVLGARQAAAAPAAVEGAVLPFTGGNVGLFLVAAVALVAAGLLLQRRRKQDIV